MASEFGEGSDLSAALSPAVSASLSLPLDERPKFIGQHVLSSIDKSEPPFAPPRQKVADSEKEALRMELRKLEDVLRAEFNYPPRESYLGA